MNKNLYNSNDEEHLHVIRLLKELPKVKAPDNFEYNLSIKIKNNKFDLKTKDSKFIFPWKIFMPATGVVTAALLLFFTFFVESETFENPFQLQPKLRTQVNGNIQKSAQNTLKNKNIISENDVILNSESAELNLASKPKSNENQFIAETKEEKPIFPFNNSTNLDEVITGSSSSNISNKASLATRSDWPSFDGFYIRNEVDKEYVEALKARMDSLKKEYRNNQRKANISK